MQISDWGNVLIHHVHEWKHRKHSPWACLFSRVKFRGAFHFQKIIFLQLLQIWSSYCFHCDTDQLWMHTQSNNKTKCLNRFYWQSKIQPPIHAPFGTKYKLSERHKIIVSPSWSSWKLCFWILKMFVSDIALWPLFVFLICFHVANFRKGPEVYNLKLFKYQRKCLLTALKSQMKELCGSCILQVLYNCWKQYTCCLLDNSCICALESLQLSF